MKRVLKRLDRLPGEITGLLALLSVLFLANAALGQAQPALALPPTPVPPLTSTNTGVIASPIKTFGDYFYNNLSTYEPIYFILGNPLAEFQLSLKYRIFDLNGRWDPLGHLYFGYTQTSFWDLLTRDPYFYDTSYKPSAFLYYPDIITNGVFHLDLQGGTEHESNGDGGTNERSLYTGYLQPTASFDLPQHFQLSFQPRGRFYYKVGENNPDIANYRGYADLLTALTWTNADSERVQFATKFRIGDEGTHVGLQYDLRFNLAFIPVIRKFNPTIQVQYFTGYGQTLRQYNQTSHALRAGICLWY